MSLKALLLLAQCAVSVSAFGLLAPSVLSRQHVDDQSLHMSVLDDMNVAGLDRRSLLSGLLGAGGAIMTGAFFVPPAFADGEAAKKVVVMGGAGYVGSRVTAALADQGFTVVSVSRSTPDEQAARIQANTGKSPKGVVYESLDATKDDLSGVFKGASVVVSCVGIPPWEKATVRAGNGLANMRIADAAKAAGVDKMVYVSVASDFASSPAKFLFGDYFIGKAEADAAITKDFGDAAVFIKPGSIEGAPPGEIRPPGPPGIATVSPDAVAKAVVAGVLGQASGSLDGYDAIMAAAK